MKVLLLGYMGAGKSTVGKQLALKLKLPFIDLDTYIEEQEKQSITGIFKSKGEIYFRLQEHIYLKELLSSKESFILALGGGTPCYANNMDLIKQYNDASSVYLKLKLTHLVERLKVNKTDRPLIASLNNEQLLEYIGKHLFERSAFYEQANKIVNVEDKSISEIVLEIQDSLT